MSADFLTQVILPLSLFLIMFGMGLSLKLEDFSRVLTYPKAMFIGLIGQMLILPLLAFIIAVALNLPAEIAVGLMILALAPGGATSNMYSYLAKGDVPLSISLTAVVSVITPFTIPIITAMSMVYFMDLDSNFQLPIIDTIIKLIVITIVPVGLGMFVLSCWANLAQKIEAFLKWFSIVFLALIVVLIVLKNRENLVDFFAVAGTAALLLNIVAMLLGFQLAKLAKLNAAQSTTIGFEVGLQNGTLALLVAGSIIGNEVMMIPIATYSIIMFFSGALFAWYVYPKAKN